MHNISRRYQDARQTSKMPNGLLTCSNTGSYAPALSRQPGPRIVRELTRSRTSLSEERSRVIARLHKGLEDATIKLTAVASDLMGKSARAHVAGVNRRRAHSRGHGRICAWDECARNGSTWCRPSPGTSKLTIASCSPNT